MTRWRRIVVALIGVMALLGAAVAYVGSSGDDDESAATPTTTADAPSATSEQPEASAPTAPPVSDEEFLAMIDELEAYVAEARGIEFLRDVQVELADDDDFEARLLEDFDESVDDLARAEVFYRALGLLPGERTLYEELEALYSVGVVGFYDPETDELVVRGTSPTAYVQQTIVHELVHALDDQHFELDRPQYDDRDDEISLGFSAVVEGNASRIDEQWLSEQPAEVREEARAQELALTDGVDLSGFPEILIFVVTAPYQFGPVFVRELLGQRGERGVDAALTDPPDTSEQFLFPQLYVDREPRVEVDAPPADGELVDEGVLGALFLYALFSMSDSSINQVDAVRAVDGWGGDWAVTWREGDAACLRADFVGDTDEDTGEIEAALDAWSDARGIGTVSTNDDGSVRLESCAAAAGGTPQV